MACNEAVDWAALIAAECAVPATPPLPVLLADLETMLRDPDPVRRDEQAYRVLVTWIGRGVLDADLTALGDRMAARFSDPAVQARTFAPLILDAIVSRGTYDPSWLAAFRDWYPRESDLRGYDERLGWLHAVAHGADLLAAFGQSAQLAPDDLTGLLDLAAARLLARTDQLFAAQEDDRLAEAIVAVLSRPELSAEQAITWLAAIADDLASGSPGPVPPYVTNTMHTLRALHLMVHCGLRIDGAVEYIPHRQPVLDRLTAVLRIFTPELG